MIELWDDRCVQVEPNTGVPVAERQGLATPADSSQRAAAHRQLATDVW